MYRNIEFKVQEVLHSGKASNKFNSPVRRANLLFVLFHSNLSKIEVCEKVPIAIVVLVPSKIEQSFIIR